MSSVLSQIVANVRPLVRVLESETIKNQPNEMEADIKCSNNYAVQIYFSAHQ